MEQYDQTSGEDGDEGGGAASPFELLAFTVRAARRHARLGLGLGVLILGLGIPISMMIPPKYDAETRILFNASAAAAPSLNASPQGDQGSREPFAGSSELLMRKANLMSIVEKAKLVQWFRTHRTLPQKVKDEVLSWVREPSSDKELLKGLAETLEKRMYVTVADKVLTIHVQWHDPDVVLTLTQLAKSSFLEMRRTQELEIITAGIAIIEDELKRAAQGIDRALQEVIQARAQAQKAALDAATTSGRSVAARSTFGRGGLAAGRAALETALPVDPKTTARLAEVRQRAQEIETPWQRRLAELKFQLTDLRGTYGPEHPIVLQQQAKITEASVPPAELTQLKATERLLITQLESAAAASADGGAGANSGANATSSSNTPSGSATGAVVGSGPPAAARSPVTGTATVVAAGGGLLLAERDEDPTIAPAKANLTAAIQRYTEVAKRLDTARLDLTASQVALDYRFSIVAEPERPRRPTKPIRLIGSMIALGAACLVGFFAGAMRDLLSGKIFEPWQIRTARIPVLGEVNMLEGGPQT